MLFVLRVCMCVGSVLRYAMLCYAVLLLSRPPKQCLLSTAQALIKLASLLEWLPNPCCFAECAAVPYTYLSAEGDLVLLCCSGSHGFALILSLCLVIIVFFVNVIIVIICL